MGVQSVVPEVDEVDLKVALGLSNPEDALVQIRPDGFWKECQNGAVHSAPAAKKGRRPYVCGLGRSRLPSIARRRFPHLIAQISQMFTGLVQATGAVTAVAREPAGVRLTVDISALPGAGFRIGDSIALSGVCCTVASLESGHAEFFLTPETLDRTWLGAAEVGSQLNLEGALRAGEPLGGHIVQGHVDGVGKIAAPIDAQEGGELWAEVPADLRKYCVEKGSITLDGVSLTIADQRDGAVMIAVIPHTAQWTTLGHGDVGAPLHVEVDVLAKYVENMLSQRGLTE